MTDLPETPTPPATPPECPRCAKAHDDIERLHRAMAALMPTQIQLSGPLPGGGTFEVLAGRVLTPEDWATIAVFAAVAARGGSRDVLDSLTGGET